MTQPTPGTSARVEQFAAEMRTKRHIVEYAVGRINGAAWGAHRPDAEALAVIRDVLAALELVEAERRDGEPR